MPLDFLLYGHTGCHNHGAEALTRSTIALLRRSFPGCRIAVSTQFAAQDREFALPADELIERDAAADTIEDMYAAAIERIRPGMVCLSMGGDLYCYRNWQRWSTLHEIARARGALSLLWSCSIDPDAIDGDMLAALRGHHRIAAREGMTYEALRARGLTNVERVGDIAFTLPAEDAGWRVPGENVALNVSPLILRRNPRAAPAFQALLDAILAETSWNVALVPHVTVSVDDDREALRALIARDPARVFLAPDGLSAARCKHIVAGARLCVAARTHVAIAAYSSGVPALAVGYSTKARGIAADLGMEAHLLDVDAISGVGDVADAFRALIRDEEGARARLSDALPRVRALAGHEALIDFMRREACG